MNGFYPQYFLRGKHVWCTWNNSGAKEVMNLMVLIQHQTDGTLLALLWLTSNIEVRNKRSYISVFFTLQTWPFLNFYSSLYKKSYSTSHLQLSHFFQHFNKHDPKLLQSVSALSTRDSLGRRCVTVADKCDPHPVLTKQGLYLGLAPHLPTMQQHL